MRQFHVPAYVYAPGKGAPIIEGSCIVATVNGTSYPLGSACQADYDLARLFAAAPRMLAALQLACDQMEQCEFMFRDDVEFAQALEETRAAIGAATS